MTFTEILTKSLDRLIFRTRAFQFVSLTILDSWPYVPLKAYLDTGKLRLFWNVCTHALQNYASLSNAYDLAAYIENRKLPGAIVECGVWRGGCAAVMAKVADTAKSNRKIWLFDSFEGMPSATKEDIGQDAKWLSCGVMSEDLTDLTPVGTNIASVEEVKELLFNRLHLKEENVVIVKGWFQNTLPAYRDRIGDIALLRIDGDWYQSTKACLETLYDNVVNNGYIIVDDYGFFPGCKKAVDEFLQERQVTVQIIKVDYSRIYFQKSAGGAQPIGRGGPSAR